MKQRQFFLFLVTIGLLTGCSQRQPTPPPPLSKEEGVKKNLDSLKRMVQAGDLLVRLGDDLLSYQIKFLNEEDQSYSHAGAVIEKDGRKWVAHISPDDGEDGIRYSDIDSFLNPAKNLSCALYRYPFSLTERDAFAATIEKYKTANINFDRVYDLATDSTMYCSEMISKAIGLSTHDRIKFRKVNVPVNMQPVLYRYFKKQLSERTIAERKIMTLDNLYRIPECRLVMRFPLKFLPGQ